jgi:hypothetical protein
LQGIVISIFQVSTVYAETCPPRGGGVSQVMYLGRGNNKKGKIKEAKGERKSKKRVIL